MIDFKNRKIIVFIVILAAITFSVTSTVMLIRPTASDDLSFLKFSSYGLFDRNFVEESWRELENQAGNIPPGSFIKYGLRLNAIYYYPILSIAIRAFEILPSLSVYQSVIISLIFFKALSLVIVLLILNKEKKISLSILIGLGMSLLFWKVIFSQKFLPFYLSNFFWFDGTIKNSILIIFLSFVLVQFLKPKIKPNCHRTVSIILVILMLGLNYPFAIMLLGLWILGNILGTFLFKKIDAIYSLVLLSFLSVLIKFVIYSSYIVELDIGMAMRDLNIFPFFWFLEVLAIVWYFTKIKKTKSDVDLTNLEWGNFVLPFFIFVSSLSIGFFLIPDYPQVHYTSNKWLTAFFEFSRRNIGISHLFFWVLAGSALY